MNSGAPSAVEFADVAELHKSKTELLKFKLKCEDRDGVFYVTYESEDPYNKESVRITCLATTYYKSKGVSRTVRAKDTISVAKKVAADAIENRRLRSEVTQSVKTKLGLEYNRVKHAIDS